jgi:hypothetical protein
MATIPSSFETTIIEHGIKPTLPSPIKSKPDSLVYQMVEKGVRHTHNLVGHECNTKQGSNESRAKHLTHIRVVANASHDATLLAILQAAESDSQGRTVNSVPT